MSGTSKLSVHKNFRIPKAVAEQLHQRAKSRNLSEAQYLVKALKAYMRER